MAESYDREIIRDLEKVPDDAHVAYQERKLGLRPFRSDTPMMREARDMRLEKMSVLRKLKTRYRGMKASRVYQRCFRELAQKDPEFWHEHWEATATELLVIQEHRMRPFRSGAPLTVEAEKARLRVMTELHRMRWHSLQYMRTYGAVARGLKEKKAAFWFEHQKFRTEELVDMLYPGARALLTNKAKWMFCLSSICFIIGSVFYAYLKSYRAGGIRNEMLYGDISGSARWRAVTGQTGDNLIFQTFGESGLQIGTFVFLLAGSLFLIALITVYVKSRRQHP